MSAEGKEEVSSSGEDLPDCGEESESVPNRVLPAREKLGIPRPQNWKSPETAHHEVVETGEGGTFKGVAAMKGSLLGNSHVLTRNHVDTIFGTASMPFVGRSSADLWSITPQVAKYLPRFNHRNIEEQGATCCRSCRRSSSALPRAPQYYNSQRPRQAEKRRPPSPPAALDARLQRNLTFPGASSGRAP